MTTALLVSSAGLIVVGWAGDYLPRYLILRVGAGLLIVTILLIRSLIAADSEHLVLLLGALALVFTISSGIWPSIVATLFPTRVRFSGIALSYNIAIIILSGLAPLAASALIVRTGILAAPVVESRRRCAIVIAVAITGSVPRKRDNSAVPISPAKQIESTHAAFEAGASVATAPSAVRSDRRQVP
jgi:MFS family permease